MTKVKRMNKRVNEWVHPVGIHLELARVGFGSVNRPHKCGDCGAEDAVYERPKRHYAVLKHILDGGLARAGW